MPDHCIACYPASRTHQPAGRRSEKRADAHARTHTRARARAHAHTRTHTRARASAIAHSCSAACIARCVSACRLACASLSLLLPACLRVSPLSCLPSCLSHSLLRCVPGIPPLCALPPAHLRVCTAARGRPRLRLRRSASLCSHARVLS
eukprot:780135-Pleurochrysis_carterae.AAC.1